MKPKIVTISEKKLIGKSVEMSLINNKTQDLFSSFMPNRNKITNALGEAIFEVLLYKDNYFTNFNPNNIFTKYGALEVKDFSNVPLEMHSFTLKEGLYAVFTYKGFAKDFGAFMQQILLEWLPNSEYTLDHRPHFHVLGEKYKNNSKDSQEEVYIPIK
ncbi:MAG: GyrI-like domain-containing protein [Oceanihabitans sp.]